MIIELKIKMAIAIVLTLLTWALVFGRNRFMDHMLLELQRRSLTGFILFATFYFTFDVLWVFWPKELPLYGGNWSMQAFFAMIIAYSGIIQGFRWLRVRRIEDIGTVGKITQTIDVAVDKGDRKRKQRLMSQKRGRRYSRISKRRKP